MRISLDLDDELYRAVTERAQAEGCSPADMLGALARRAHGMPPGKPDSFFGFTPFQSGGGRVTNADIDRIRDDLDI